nr:ribonuclease H-like domain, reverse transcriptase, RNA-dependent DNA polymerase [Tanacetum cinerariifolium]
GIFISQDKYVTEVLRKFNITDVKSASTLVDMENTFVKDADGDDVDVHLYRSMIGSLMYLTTSRPDIIDYAGASLDWKSTTGGCQFLRSRLIS